MSPASASPLHPEHVRMISELNRLALANRLAYEEYLRACAEVDDLWSGYRAELEES
jgi:hypothetical protein